MYKTPIIQWFYQDATNYEFIFSSNNKDARTLLKSIFGINNINWVHPYFYYSSVKMNMIDFSYPDCYNKENIEKFNNFLMEKFKKVLKSVDGGYLAIGYYGKYHDNIGFLHSATSFTACINICKNNPPRWFELKSFC